MADILSDRPGYLLRRVQQIAASIFADECAAFDITPVQYAALSAIGAHPGLDATRIGALASIDRSTLGALLERLEAKSLIERKPHPQDKRIKALRLSRRGVALLRDVEPAVERAQQRIVATLPAQERRALIAGLVAIIEANEQSAS